MSPRRCRVKHISPADLHVDGQDDTDGDLLLVARVLAARDEIGCDYDEDEENEGEGSHPVGAIISMEVRALRSVAEGVVEQLGEERLRVQLGEDESLS